ncbi:MAG: NAD-dependent epimerase/dehydratase family protein [Patescibacteria group bacterium]
MKIPSSILITGVAGFIGSTLARTLLTKKVKVIGIDNFYPNYSKKYKQENLKALTSFNHFQFHDINILSSSSLKGVFKKYRPQAVIHLAALTGVRASIANPKIYFDVNVRGTRQVFETASDFACTNFIYSSSSSVYGKGNGLEFLENKARRPSSPYAISKRDSENILQLLHQKYKMPTTIFRLFSVYGPQGRPDMAPYLFTQAAFSGKSITIFGNGTAARDFTYITDVVSAFQSSLANPSPLEIVNIGNTSPISISELIQLTEKLTRKKLLKKFSPPIPQESFVTHANIDKAQKLYNWYPKVKFKKGFALFVRWYRYNRL